MPKIVLKRANVSQVVGVSDFPCSTMHVRILRTKFAKHLIIEVVQNLDIPSPDCGELTNVLDFSVLKT